MPYTYDTEQRPIYRRDIGDAAPGHYYLYGLKGGNPPEWGGEFEHYEAAEQEAKKIVSRGSADAIAIVKCHAIVKAADVREVTVER